MIRWMAAVCIEVSKDYHNYWPRKNQKCHEDQSSQYKHLAVKTVQLAYDLYRKTDWKLEKQLGQDTVYSRKDPKAGTIFKVETEVNISSKLLMDELYLRVNDLHKWNTSIKESYRVQAIDECTDITYQVSKDSVGGLVSSRDFVNLRQWTIVDGVYIMCCVKCDHPKLPPTNKYVRAENGVGGYVVEPIPNQDNKCRFIWIINPNLNIRIPRFILDKEIVKMMLLFARDLNRHIMNTSGDLS